MSYPLLTQEKLREILDYNPITGTFTWRKTRSSKAGWQAGTPNREGVVQIRIRTMLWPASSLAFLYMTGEVPNCVVKYRNQDKGDTSWSNLELDPQDDGMPVQAPPRRWQPPTRT